MLITGNQVLYLEYFPYFFALIILIYNNVVYESKIRIPRTILDKAIFIFSVYIFLSIYFISSDKSYGLEKFQFYILSVILFYLPILLIKSQKDIDKFFKGIYYFGFILSVIGFMQLSGYGNFLIKDFGGRFNFFRINPIWVGRYFSYAIIVEIYLIMVYSKNLSYNIGKIIFVTTLIILQFYFILLTGSRGPLSALIIALIYLIISRIKFNVIKIIYSITSLLIILIFLYSLIPDDIIERILTTTYTGKLTVIIRILANIEAFNFFKSNILTGIGFGAYKFGGEIIDYLIYPHNVFMEILSETGIIGFILFFFIVFYPVYLFQIRKHLLDKNQISLIMSTFIVALINSNLSGHIGANYYLWFSIGVMYSTIIIKADQKLIRSPKVSIL